MPKITKVPTNFEQKQDGPHPERGAVNGGVLGNQKAEAIIDRLASKYITQEMPNVYIDLTDTEPKISIFDETTGSSQAMNNCKIKTDPDLIIIELDRKKQPNDIRQTPSVEGFDHELEKILNPIYGTPEWIEETKKLFDGFISPTQSGSRRTLTQKLNPKSRHGRYEAIKPSRLQRIRKFAKAIGQSLLATSSDELLLPASTVTQNGPHHARLPTKDQPNKPEARTSFKHKFALVALGTLALGSSLNLVGAKKLDDSSLPSKPVAESVKPGPESSTITIKASEPAVEIVQNLESPGTTFKLDGSARDNEVSTSTSDTFSITIEKGGNIWDATKAELQKNKPNVTNQEVSKKVNEIIVVNNITDPNVVFAGNQFSVSVN